MRFTRREFLQSGAIVGAGLVSGLTWPRALAGPGAGVSAGAIDLAVARGASPAKNCLAAVAALGGFSRFVRAGDKVVVKPNPVGESRPERAINTHPDMVEAVVRECLRAGAREVVVLSHDPLRSFEKNGTGAAVTRAGGVVKALGERAHFREVLVPRARILPRIALATDLLDAEVFINMPIAKHHAGSRVTLAMKNLMGMNWDRDVFHQTDLQRCIAEIASAVPHSLVILDANHVLLTNGPAGPGRVRDPGEVVAGVDPVAVDAFAVERYFGLEPGAIGHIRAAYDLGVGEIDRAKLAIREFDA